MISFRFHVVSITAVFLAIALGVVVGSTYVDRAIVGNLERRIDVVRANLDERLDDIERLDGELDRMNDYADASAPFAVSGRLAGEAVLVLALRGVDDEPVRRAIDLATLAGGAAPGILWVEPRWSLEDDGAVDDLAALVDTSSGQADVVRSIAWEAVLDELEAPLLEPTEPSEPTEPTGETSTTTSTTVAPSVETPTLDALVEGGFLTFESTGEGVTVASVAAQSPMLAAVTGSAADARLQPLLAALVDGAVRRGLATLVAEVFVAPEEDDAEAPDRGDLAVGAVPEGATAEVSVIDHLEQRVGQVAAVLALADLRQSVVGHYGLGDGAAALVPTWTPLEG
jgi:hypothetical protein